MGLCSIVGLIDSHMRPTPIAIEDTSPSSSSLFVVSFQGYTCRHQFEKMNWVCARVSVALLLLRTGFQTWCGSVLSFSRTLPFTTIALRNVVERRGRGGERPRNVVTTIVQSQDLDLSGEGCSDLFWLF